MMKVYLSLIESIGQLGFFRKLLGKRLGNVLQTLQTMTCSFGDIFALEVPMVLVQVGMNFLYTHTCIATVSACNKSYILKV